MTGYRQPSPPASTRIELATHDQKKLLVGMLTLIGSILVLSVGSSIVVRHLVPRERQPLIITACLGLGGLAFVPGLLVVMRRLREVRFLLDIGDASIRLLLPNGQEVADTLRGDLAFMKVTYTRRGRHGSSWVRPGFRMRHRGGNHLIGILMPPAPLWPEGEQVPHDGGMPEFELRPQEFEALRARVVQAR